MRAVVALNSSFPVLSYSLLLFTPGDLTSCVTIPRSAPLIPGINKHLENWHFVERCTVNDRYYALNKYLDVNIEKITNNKRIIITNGNDYTFPAINVENQIREYACMERKHLI